MFKKTLTAILASLTLTCSSPQTISPEELQSRAYHVINNQLALNCKSYNLNPLGFSCKQNNQTIVYFWEEITAVRCITTEVKISSKQDYTLLFTPNHEYCYQLETAFKTYLQL